MSEFPAGRMKGSNDAVGRHQKGCERSGAIGSIIKCMNNNHYDVRPNLMPDA